MNNDTNTETLTDRPEDSDTNEVSKRNVGRFRLWVLLIIFFLFLFAPQLFQHYSSWNNGQSVNQPLTQSKEDAVRTDPSHTDEADERGSVQIFDNDNCCYSDFYLSQSSAEEPSIQVQTASTKGEMEIVIYKTNIKSLLDTLVYDDKENLVNKAVDVGNMQHFTTFKKYIDARKNNSNKIALPLSKTGVWYVKVKWGSASDGVFLVRSQVGAALKESGEEVLYWGQDFGSLRSIVSGDVAAYSLKNSVKMLYQSAFDSQGIAKAPVQPEADVAVVTRGEDVSLIPIGLASYGKDTLQRGGLRSKKEEKYFLFTDRPLYRPGDKINFKAIIRDDDDAVYTIPTGNLRVAIYSQGNYEAPIFQSDYSISSTGAVDGVYELPKDTQTGSYSIVVATEKSEPFAPYSYLSNTQDFQVEHFRKPNQTIDVSIEKNEYIAGDKLKFNVKGKYFSGQPMTNQSISYRIVRGAYYSSSYLTEDQNANTSGGDMALYGYSHGSGDMVSSGKLTLDKNGVATGEYQLPKTDVYGNDMVYTVETTLADGSQNPSYDNSKTVVYAGEYGIYRAEYSYSFSIKKPQPINIVLQARKEGGNVSAVELKGEIVRENWVEVQRNDSKYPDHVLQKEKYQNISIRTNQSGKATIQFAPSKTGSYTIDLVGRDERGNAISQNFYMYVTEDDVPIYTGQKDAIIIRTNKSKYEPNETVGLNIYSEIPDRDLLVTIERGSVRRHQTVRIEGRSKDIDIPLTNTDIPNIFITAQSFSQKELEKTSVPVTVSTDTKKLSVKLHSNEQKYLPGETVEVDLSTKDKDGKGVSSEVALWAVDKSLFELVPDSLRDIFDAFWAERYNSTWSYDSLQVINTSGGMGGCFAAGTKILMSNGDEKNIEDVKKGDIILTRTSEKNNKLVKAKVASLHHAKETGYLIVNNTIRVTTNHRMWVNGDWKEAGSIQRGDAFTDVNGRSVWVSSIQWQAGVYDVYNLEIERYHTYFANGVWVHNEKGDVRSVFKDVAYWNPVIRTDEQGDAKVRFIAPDNLTTWVLVAVAATENTQVGQGTSEITVSKDFVIRPILPNIMRLGDTVSLSAIVQNSTDQRMRFNTSLNFDSGVVEQLNANTHTLGPNDQTVSRWTVLPKTQTDGAQLNFSAVADGDKKDIVQERVPILKYGFKEKSTQFKAGETEYKLKFEPKVDKNNTKVTLSLSSTIIGSLPAAMKYLVDYAYGCVEQTTSRFVPVVIADENSTLFAEALKDKDVDDIVNKAIKRLTELQNGDGGWFWYGGRESDPFVTAYVVEYLVRAINLNGSYDKSALRNSTNYLEQKSVYDFSSGKERKYSTQEIVARNYALTTLGRSSKKNIMPTLKGLSPDLLALAVMANYKNGEKDPRKNGLLLLQKMSVKQGDMLYWQAGNPKRYGSKDASTALAMRAILTAKGDVNFAIKGARYLMSRRQHAYWSNTFATSQAIQALTELSKVQNEAESDYAYSVYLDDKMLGSGVVKGMQNNLENVQIPSGALSDSGSTLSIRKSGKGQLYSVLEIDQFITDNNAKSKSQGMSLKREYVNVTKGNKYNIGVGDIVTVRLTVDGLDTEESYAVIEDELPAGMVPVNEEFINEGYSVNDHNSYYANKEYSLNGAVLTLYNLKPGKQIFEYRARVVSAGAYQVPPARAMLMYNPEINARTKAEVLKIAPESTKFAQAIMKNVQSSKVVNIEESAVKKEDNQNRNLTIVLFMLIGAGIYMHFKK